MSKPDHNSCLESFLIRIFKAWISPQHIYVLSKHDHQSIIIKALNKALHDLQCQEFVKAWYSRLEHFWIIIVEAWNLTKHDLEGLNWKARSQRPETCQNMSRPENCLKHDHKGLNVKTMIVKDWNLWKKNDRQSMKLVKKGPLIKVRMDTGRYHDPVFLK